LDRFDLYDVTNGEQATYPAIDARLANGATPTSAGAASLTGAGSATFFAATAETGYYDISTNFQTTGMSTVALSANGRSVQLPAASTAGTWTATARVFLPQGLNELGITAPSGATVSSVTLLRGASQKASDTDAANVYRSEAESLPLAGTARVQTVASGSNGSADASGTVRDVGFIGNGAGNTLSIPRPTGFGAGEYQLVLGTANADKSASINYNPQLISRFLNITETGAATTRAAFRHNYAWNSFWDKTVPLSLTTTGGTLVLGNTTGYGPDIDNVTLAKFVAGTPTIQ